MEDKLIKIIRENERAEVEYKNVDTLEILSLVATIVINLLQDLKEGKGMAAYGELLEVIAKVFSVKTLDFLVHIDETADFAEQAAAFIMDEIHAYEKEEADDQ